MAYWCPKKSYLTRIFAQDMVRSAIPFYESLVLARESTIPEHFTLPDTDEWFELYNNNQLVDSINKIFETQSIGSIVLTNHKRVCVGQEPVIPETIKGLSHEEIYQKHLEEIWDDILGRDLTTENIKFAKQHVLTSQFLFLWKVINPCQLLYNSHPHELFNIAKLGDVDALCKLLKLDKLLIGNPIVSDWIVKYSQQKDKSSFEQLSNALAKPIRSRHTLSTAKIYLAGYISFMCDLLSQTIKPELRSSFILTAPEIRKLFDAVAVDYGVTELCDEDLPLSDEALAKAIQRHKENLKKRFLPQ